MHTENFVLRSERSIRHTITAFTFVFLLVLIEIIICAYSSGPRLQIFGLDLFIIVFAPALSIIGMLMGPWAPIIYLYSDRLVLIRKFRPPKIIRFENLRGYYTIMDSIDSGPDFADGIEIFYGDKSVRIKNQTVKNAIAINNFLSDKGVKRLEKGTGWDVFTNWLLVAAGLIIVWMVLYALVVL